MSWLASALRASLVDDLEHLSTRDATDHITRVVLAGHHWTLPDERVIELVMAQHGFLALLIAEARAAGADRATLTLARTLGAEPCSPVLRRRKMLELARVTGELLNFTNRTAHQESHADR